MKRIRESFKEMSELLRTEGSFVQNSAWMFSSTGISILIQIVFFLVLSRIYSPAVYGLFGVFNVYLGVLGNAASLGYTLAFVLPEKERDFGILLRLTLWITLGVCALAALFFALFGQQTLRLFEHEQLGGWVHAIAPVAFLMAVDKIVCDWAIRNKEFKQQMIWSTSTTLASKIFNVFYGLKIAPTVAGLVVTTGLQYILRIVAYARFGLSDFGLRMREKITRSEMKSIAKEYSDYPVYIHWGNVINIFSNNLPAALLPMLGFTMSDVGYYTNSLIVLDMPIRLLGAGIASVFLQKAAELARDRREELNTHTWRLYKNILLASLVFLFIVGSFGESLYAWVLGENWRMAGRAVEVLVLFYFFRMIASPLSVLFNVLRREKEQFIFQVILAIARIASLIVGGLYTHDFIELMWIYAIVNAVLYFIYAIRIFQLLQYKVGRMIALTLGGCVVVLFASNLVKALIILLEIVD
ncbi:MAG: oligosaccharide flippase family protein [Flavobacteriales bacterium]